MKRECSIKIVQVHVKTNCFICWSNIACYTFVILSWPKIVCFFQNKPTNKPFPKAMYSNKPIDPESYSNASSTEGIIQKKSKWDQMQDSLSGMNFRSILMLSNRNVVFRILDHKADSTQGCGQDQSDQDNIARIANLLCFSHHYHLQ